MTVTKDKTGQWFVTAGKRQLAGPFTTMAEGWRWIDRQTGQTINRSEDVAAWVWSKEIDR